MRSRLLIATLVVAGTMAAAAAPAAATHGQDIQGPYSGFASGTVAHLDAVTSGTTRLGDVEVGVTDAAVNSSGLSPVLSEYGRTIVPGDLEGKHARAVSSILEAGYLLSPPEADNQLRPLRVEATAPEEASTSASALTLPVSSVAYADVLTRSAQANYDSTCVVGAPIAVAEEHILTLQLLEQLDDAETPVSGGFDQPLAGVYGGALGPRRSAASSVAVQQLFASPEGRFGLMSAVSTTLAPITLFEGTPNETTIEVDGPATLWVDADGTPGGAKATYKAPVVSVIRNGLETLVVPSEPFRLAQPGGAPLLTIEVGTINPMAGAKGLGDVTTLANGTRAAAEANVIEVTIHDLPTAGTRALTLALGHMEVGAAVPAGGVRCPIPVTKTATPNEVSTGDTFDTIITVTNTFECALENVVLSDAITTERAARFTVASTSPKATSAPSGAGLASGTVRWSIGRLEPGDSTKVAVTLDAVGGAGKILDTASASGTLVNCRAGRATGAADVSGLSTISVAVSGSASLEVPAARVLGEFMADTGTPAQTAALAGWAFMGLGAAMHRLSRRRR